jgi:hypothetical protein
VRRRSASRRQGRRRARHLAAWLAAAIALGAIVVKVGLSNGGHPSATPCTVSIGDTSYALDREQAAHATTIAAVGKRLQLPDHAVTVALAAALQESKLHNVQYGDLDSLGLFQQRPSQGWGTPGDILVPRLAAASFYNRLRKVPGWEGLPVTAAAQAVQRSAAPDAYAQWEPEARVLARALTGEAPGGFSCQLATPKQPPDPAVTDALVQELGRPGLGEPMDPGRAWTAASWLVGHAEQYRLTTVAVPGYRWTARSGVWTPADTGVLGATVPELATGRGTGS